ncbi:MAG: hypothetical protein AB7D29_01640 [Campylobacterales bacterium]
MQRTVSFNKMFIQNAAGLNINPLPIVNTLQSAFSNNTRLQNAYDLSTDRFCVLSHFIQNTGSYQGKIITASRNYRPDYIDRHTMQERPNAKTMSEGEEDAVHFVAKIDIATNELIILLEERQPGHGLTIGQLAEYINELMKRSSAIPQNHSLKFGVIASDNFIDDFNQISRVKVATLKINKQLIGSNYLNVANLTSSTRDTIDIVIKSKPKHDIKSDILEVVRNFATGTETRITEVLIEGNDIDNNPVVLNSEFAKRKQYINVPVNPQTGEIQSMSMFSSLEAIIQTM